MYMISPEELSRIRALSNEFINPPHPRTGDQTIAIYERLQALVMDNLVGLLDAAQCGVDRKR
jgi:hypothetical protein